MRRADRNSAFQLLADFGGRKAAAQLDPQEELRFAREEGYQAGILEARAQAEADYEARLAKVAEDHAAKLAFERMDWDRNIADVLGAQMTAGLASIERSVSDRVAALLKPWLIERLHDRAMHDFEKAIERALGEGSRVEIEGPSEVLAGLRARLSIDSPQTVFTESDAPGIKARLDDSRVEIDVAAWLVELESGRA